MNLYAGKHPRTILTPLWTLLKVFFVPTTVAQTTFLQKKLLLAVKKNFSKTTFGMNCCSDKCCSDNCCSDNCCSDNYCSDNCCPDNCCSDNFLSATVVLLTNVMRTNFFLTTFGRARFIYQFCSNFIVNFFVLKQLVFTTSLAI